MDDKHIIEYIDKKVKNNPQIVKYTFFELKVKNNLSDKEIQRFLEININYLQNNNYNIYKSGEKYEYKDKLNVVKENELLVAVKREEQEDEHIIKTIGKRNGFFKKHKPKHRK